VIQHAKGGKVRILATWGDARHPALPDVPTLKELGYDAQYSQWTGPFVPAGTPEPVIAKLREAAKFAADDACSRARSRRWRRRSSISTSRNSALSGRRT
jgi:tripartite-type tricarboxylate transporter receptor subunit TctC